jgi:transcriptional regulator with PAS, ATPase and Fis domain
VSAILAMRSHDTAPAEHDSDGFVIGHSAGWADAIKRATLVAPTEATVLLQGESGTGKEVMARLIHTRSPRGNRPFVAINCAALPENLLESELFGYERGAFTGAQQAKPGQVEIAAGGVLFLDEVSEMSLAAQAKFLRFLQEREFQRLGGTRVVKTNVRIIAATNRDLHQAMERGSFRPDLYYRLQVFTIQLPPLRERQADILPLADAFLRDIGRAMRRPRVPLTQEATEALLSHTWPGNVRELRNALERAAIVCEDGAITAAQLSLAAPRRSPQFDQAEVNLDALQRRTIARVLDQVRGNKAHTQSTL